MVPGLAPQRFMMASLAACNIADRFMWWVLLEREQWVKEIGKRPFPDQPRFYSYDEAYAQWLRHGGGFEEIACDYGLAVEVLLAILTRVHEDDQRDIPLVCPTRSDHNWEHMTESGFRHLLYHWRNDPHRRLRAAVTISN